MGVVFITGQRGDVGTWLSRLYEEDGWRVIPLEEASIQEARGGRWLHLAAKSPPADQAALNASNQVYLLECLERAQSLGLAEVVFFSAMSAYGAQNQEDLNEEEVPVDPDPYGQSKLWGERLLRRAPLKALCLRLPAVLGMRNTTNFPARCFQALSSGQDLTLRNADRLFNNFLGVEDLYRFLRGLRIIHPWDVVNLAVEKKLTLGEVVDVMVRELGSSSKILTSGRQGPFFNISTLRAQHRYGFVPPDPTASLKRWIEQRRDWLDQGWPPLRPPIMADTLGV